VRITRVQKLAALGMRRIVLPASVANLVRMPWPTRWEYRTCKRAVPHEPAVRLLYIPQDIDRDSARQLLTQVRSLPREQLGHLMTIVSRLGSRPPRLLDTSRSLGLFQQAGVPILGVIENMSALTCPHCGETIEVFSRSVRQWTVGDKALSQLGHIPMATTISRCIDAGHPLMQGVPDAAEAMAFRQIASAVSRKLGLRA
jgi:hypothetical protein